MAEKRHGKGKMQLSQREMLGTTRWCGSKGLHGQTEAKGQVTGFMNAVWASEMSHRVMYVVE